MIGTALLGPVIGGVRGHHSESGEIIRTTLRIFRDAGADSARPHVTRRESAVGEHGWILREHVRGAV